jgi:PhnB protein
VKVLTQLNFGGNCEEAFRFYEKHLGGKIVMMMHQDEAPGSTATKESGKAVIHARLALGGTVLLGNDVPASRFERMRSVYIYLSVESTEEAERVYKILSEGGEVYMPLSETFYATRFSQFRDRFGVSWSLIHERMQMQ